jgi:hypothetical protein
MNHLSRYDHILMLRAVWRSGSIRYQLIEVPIDTLRLIGRAEVLTVGRRKGRKSMAANVYSEGEKLFRVHFDGVDGICQIHRLPLSKCRLLLEWDQSVSL